MKRSKWLADAIIINEEIYLVGWYNYNKWRDIIGRQMQILYMKRSNWSVDANTIHEEI